MVLKTDIVGDVLANLSKNAPELDAYSNEVADAVTDALDYVFDGDSIPDREDIEDEIRAAEWPEHAQCSVCSAPLGLHKGPDTGRLDLGPLYGTLIWCGNMCFDDIRRILGEAV